MKKTWVRKTLSVGVLAAGALLLAPTAAALAGPGQSGIGTSSGSLVAMPSGLPGISAGVLDAPIDACGKVLGLLGSATGTGACGDEIGDRPLESRPVAYGKKQVEKRTVKHDKKRIESGSGFFPGIGGLGGLFGQSSCGNSFAVLGYASAGGSCSGNVGYVHRKRAHWVKRVVPVYTPGYLVGGRDCGDWNVYRASTLYGVVADYDDYGSCGGGYDDGDGFGVIASSYTVGGYIGGSCGAPVFANVGGCSTPGGYGNVGGYSNGGAYANGGAYGTPGNNGGAYGTPGNNGGNPGSNGGYANTGNNGGNPGGNPGSNGGYANTGNNGGKPGNNGGKPGNGGNPGGAYGTPGNNGGGNGNAGNCKNKAHKADKDHDKNCKKKPAKNTGKGDSPVRGNPDGYGDQDVDDAGYQNGGNRGNAPADVQDDGYGASGDANGNTKAGGRSAE